MAKRLSFLETPVGTSGLGQMGVEIMPAVDVADFSRCSIEIYNTEGGTGDTIDRIALYGTVSGDHWSSLYDSSNGLQWSAANGAYILSIADAQYSQVMVEALCATSDTEVDVHWIGEVAK